jgi:hypothetical protein
MLKEQYSFYLTMAQRCAIRDVALDNVYFGSDGSVIGMSFGEYEIVMFTFRRDGEIVRESRALDSDGWVTTERSSDGVWAEDLEEVE